AARMRSGLLVISSFTRTARRSCRMANRCCELSRFRRSDGTSTRHGRPSGLAGTGSHHVILDNVAVSEAESFDLLHGPSCVPGRFETPFMPFIGSVHVAVAIGIAAGAIADLASMAGSGRRQLFAAADLRDSP